MLRCVRTLVVLGSLVVVPTAVFAQASIVGTARDASGAVLPGVTVEASSPALIEKTRSVVTNGVGQYSIQDLRPGHLLRHLYAARVHARSSATASSWPAASSRP